MNRAESMSMTLGGVDHYDEDRLHGAIGNTPPILLQNSGGAPSPPP